MVTFIFSLFTGENLSCVSFVGVRGLVFQCHRGHSHVSLFEFSNVADVPEYISDLLCRELTTARSIRLSESARRRELQPDQTHQ